MSTTSGLPNALRLILLLLPLVVIQIGLMVFALIDLAKRENVKGEKWIWALLIILVNIIGPIIYFVVARQEPGATASEDL